MLTESEIKAYTVDIPNELQASQNDLPKEIVFEMTYYADSEMTFRQFRRAFRGFSEAFHDSYPGAGRVEVNGDRVTILLYQHIKGEIKV